MKQYHLIPQQLAMYLEWIAHPESSEYVNGTMATVPDSVQTDRLRAAIEQLPVLHPEMRTVFVMGDDGEPRQYINPDLHITLTETTISDDTTEQCLSQWMKPFDLNGGEPLWRFLLVHTPTATYFLIISHHIVSDGTTFLLLMRQIGQLYAGQTLEPCTGFMDWAEANYKAAPQLWEQDKLWWTQYMDDADILTLGRDTDNKVGTALKATADVSDMTGVDQWCGEHGISPATLFMTAFAYVLGAYHRKRRVAFCTGVHGRNDKATKGFANMFVQTLPVVVDIDPTLTAHTIAATLRQNLHESMSHTAYTFSQLCQDMGQGMGASMVYMKGMDLNIDLEGTTCRMEQIPRPSLASDVTVYVYPYTDHYHILLEVSDALMSQTQADTFITAMATVVGGILHNADTPLARIPLVSGQEQTALLAQARGETLDYDHSETFIDMLDGVTATHADDRALVGTDATLTYAQLQEQSTALARRLMDQGVQPGDHVGLMLPRQAGTLMAMVAVQRVGAAYVPLDGEYPAQRLAYMLTDSEASLLITTHALWEACGLEAEGVATPVLYMEDMDLTTAPDSAINLARPELPAYMIYTSGSTGLPKGVEVPHRALRAMLAWGIRDNYDTGGNYAAHPSFSFDASIFDIFCPLACGGTTHVLDEALRKDMSGMISYICDNNIEGMTCSTAIGQALVALYPDLPLKCLMMGGEKMLPFPPNSIRMINGYGPTEFTVCSSYHVVDQEHDFEHDIPIGRPVPNTWSMICDHNGNLLPKGVEGELCLAGPQLSLGYYKKEGKTAEAFVPCTMLKESGVGTMYRTGDLARYNATDELEFLGRIDFQVKLRGFRIELGEIEHVAKGFAGVGAVIALVQEVAGNKMLCLYYTATAPVDKEALKAHMAEHLTYYMVPDSLNELDTMPMTPGGKINRRALPLPIVEAEETVAPENKMERLLLDSVSELLGSSDFGVTSNLISHGLSSLLAMKLSAELQRDWGFSIKTPYMLAHPTIRQMADYLRNGGEQEQEAKAEARDMQATYPLTDNQRGLYIEWEMNPKALQYNMPTVLRVKAPADKVEQALKSVVDAHPYLKATLVKEDGEVRVRRNDDATIAITRDTAPADADGSRFKSGIRPFDLFAEPLCRLTLCDCGGHSLVFFDAHHIIFDGVSMAVFMGDLCKALDGQSLTAETYTAYDHALDVEEAMASEHMDKALAYFDTLMGDFEVASLPHSADDSHAQKQLGTVNVKVPAEAVNAFCRKEAVTPNSFFMAATTQTLHRITREPSLLITSITNGRDTDAMQTITGMFVQTLPVVTTAATASDTVASVVRAMQQQYIDTQANALVPYTTITERYKAKAEVMYAYEGGLFADNAEQKVELLPTPFSLDTVKMPIDITVTEDAASFGIRLEYDTSSYSATDMHTLAASIATMAEAMATGANAAMQSIGLVPATKMPELIQACKGPDLRFDTSKTFIDLFVSKAAEQPEATAVVDADGTLSYGQLDRRSNTLAHKLMEAGVEPNKFVGFMVPRRAWWPVSIIGIQKAGAAYMPLDVDYPMERLEYMISNSEARVLVTTRQLYEQKCAEGNINIEKVLFLDEIDYTQDTEPINLATPEGMAYIIYTSGSTGLPKGAMLHHRGLLNFIYGMQVYNIQPGDHIGAHRSFSFDAHLDDFYPTLAAGAELHILPSEIRQDTSLIHRYILDHELQGIGFTTSVTMLLLDAYPDMPLRYISAGGEKLSNVYSDHIRIINLYGPTECTNNSTHHVMEPGTREDNIPIGRPMPNLHCFVTDTAGQILPLGMAGELCIAGPQVSYGYWKLPEKTAECFVPCPFLPGEQMYRTGDLVRYNTQGDLEYIGRIDSQVKFHGFRIELGEIERHAMAFPITEEAVAKVVDMNGVKHLVLYATAKAGATLRSEELKQYLEGTSLARYMLPEAIMVLDKMPRLPNGKIARKLMPQPVIERTAEYVEPATDTERTICRAFASVLSLDQVGATDDFFAIGGSSLAVMRLIVELAKANLEVVYADVFDNATPRKLAALITGEKADKPAVDTEITDFDYTAISKVLEANTLDAFRQGERQRLGRVMLAGSTGYLGIHILRELLAATDCEGVVCLARGTSDLTPEQQLRSLLFYYFEQTYDSEFASGRITVVKGDITQPDTLSQIEGVDTVVNCAAVVKHFANDDSIERVNVGGVENLIDFCLNNGARMVQVSTCSVASLSVDGYPDVSRVLSEHDLYFGQILDNKYVRSKFLADRAVLQAIATRGLSAKIMRVGNLSARDTDGDFQINSNTNNFMRSLRALTVVGACTYEQLDGEVEFSPIDAVARAIVMLTSTPRECCVFHPTNPHRTLMEDIVGEMNKLGLTITSKEAHEVQKDIEAAEADPAKAEALSSLVAYKTANSSAVMLRASNTYTLSVLRRMGYTWPITSWDYVRRFLRALVAMGFFEA